MPLNTFNPKYQGVPTKSLKTKAEKFKHLLDALEGKEISESVLDSVNAEIDKVNQAESMKVLTAQVGKSFQKILKIVEKELNLVGKNHYRNMWLALGMSVFGIPLGVAFSASLGNYAFIGLGLPIGLAIGIAIGTKKDKEASEQGRQLEIEL